ncbi:MAG: response regulator [Alphaproteobacteria bacterium]|nr:response regulator [Alphaproteobacteria bacterium]QQS56942.1 MAG: response regulator [Alphaproteobacteria bacterium]
MAKILLAEDDPSMLNFLEIALRRAGHDVLPASDGLEALEVLEDGEEFDLLLTDIVMPGIDGIELAQKAMQIQPDLKVMFITGFAAMAVSTHREEMKNTKLLSKPFHLSDLVSQIEEILAT